MVHALYTIEINCGIDSVDEWNTEEHPLPIPNVGDCVLVGEARWKVLERLFKFVDQGHSHTSIVELQCERA